MPVALSEYNTFIQNTISYYNKKDFIDQICLVCSMKNKIVINTIKKIFEISIKVCI